MSPAQWEDITGTTPLSFVTDCVSFTTNVSARWVTTTTLCANSYSAALTGTRSISCEPSLFTAACLRDFGITNWGTSVYKIIFSKQIWKSPLCPSDRPLMSVERKMTDLLFAHRNVSERANQSSKWYSFTGRVASSNKVRLCRQRDKLSIWLYENHVLRAPSNIEWAPFGSVLLDFRAVVMWSPLKETSHYVWAFL